MQIEGLEKLDQQILSLIQNQARMSYTEIGAALGVSRVCVKNHMEAMEQKGIIKGYQTILDTGKIDNGIPFLLDVQTMPDHYLYVAGVLSQEKMITKVYGLTGANWIHCMGTAANMQSLDYLVRTLGKRTKGVESIKYSVVISTFKDADGGVFYDRNQESKHMEE